MKGHKNSCTCVTMKALVLVLLVGVVSCIPLRDSLDVTLVRAMNDELEVNVVWGNDGSGMTIEAKHDRLAILSTNSGEVFLFGEHIEGSGMFISALGSSFFSSETIQEDGTVLKTDYSVPQSISEQVKDAFEQRKTERMISMFDQDDTARHSAQLTMDELVRRPEVRMLEKTAYRLGEMGVVGASNRGALLFYMTVLKLLSGREREQASRSRGNRVRESLGGLEEENVIGQPEKRNSDTSNIPPANSTRHENSPTSHKDAVNSTTVASTPTNETAPTTNKTTPTSSPLLPCHQPPPPIDGGPYSENDPYADPSDRECAPAPIPDHLHECQEVAWTGKLCEDCSRGYECREQECPLGEEEGCVGMCGKGCWCWRWVCGDCCRWQGCHRHDRICESSFWSWECVFPFAFGFDCNGY